MNRLFRIATRALSWGLIAILSLVIVVVINGIPRETLVAFQNLHEETRIAAQSSSSTPPEFYAQAASPGTRLDVPAGVRPSSNSGRKLKVRAIPDFPLASAKRLNTKSGQKTPEVPPTEEGATATLPPLPDSPEGFAKSADETDPPEAPQSEASQPEASQPDQVAQDSGEKVLLLPPPPDELESPPESVSDVEPTVVAERSPSPTAEGSRPKTPAPRAGQAQSPASSKLDAPAAAQEANVRAQLSVMREQLNRIAETQEKNLLSQQSWLESHHLLHQRELQQKLDAIEAKLRDLKIPQPDPAVTAKPTESGTIPRGYIMRQDKIITTPAGPEGSPAFVRDMLQSLADRSNLNVTLSINVEGDVEMSLQNSAASETLNALQKLPGYVLEKNGKRIQIPPQEPMQHQREAFLPPIVNDPPAPPR